MRKRPPRKALVPIALWDIALRLVAIRRALRRKEYRWVAVLAVTSSGGLVPLIYLWHTRGEQTGRTAGEHA